MSTGKKAITISALNTTFDAARSRRFAKKVELQYRELFDGELSGVPDAALQIIQMRFIPHPDDADFNEAYTEFKNMLSENYEIRETNTILPDGRIAIVNIMAVDKEHADEAKKYL